MNFLWLIINFKPFQEIIPSKLGPAKGQNSTPTEIDINTLNNSSQIIINEGFIKFQNYFDLIDSISSHYLNKKSSIPGDLLIVWFNNWILNRLKSTDYHIASAAGNWVYDLSEEVIFSPGDTILIPDSIAADSAANALLETRLVLNIPEFRLRLIRGNDTILS